jgi:hypothetical protein
MKKLVSFEEYSSSKEVNEKVSLPAIFRKSKNKKDFSENLKKGAPDIAKNKEFLEQLEKSFSKTEE